MKYIGAFATRITLLAILVIAWVGFFTWLGRRLDMVDWWALGLIGAALFTFFGLLIGSIDQNGALRESQIRLAITATLIVIYVVYFGTSVYFIAERNERGEPLPSFAKDLLPTLTNLLMVSISFYFGSTAAIEIAKTLSKKG